MKKGKYKIVEVKGKPEKCPNCGGRIIPILYGEPNEEGGALIYAGEMILGGCIVSGNDPQWGCTDCNTEYLDIED